MENFLTAADLKEKLGGKYISKIRAKVPSLTNSQVWDALNGRCNDLGRINEVQVASRAAMQDAETLAAIKAKQLAAKGA